MLDKLFGSNSRVKLLKLFFLHPKSKFYIREVARHLGLQLNSVYRELNNLEEIGLLLSENGPVPEGEEPEEKSVKKKSAEIKKQEKKYYRLNPEFIFYNEIQALIMKSQLLYEKDFTEKLKKVGDINLLVLAGIFVSRTEAPVDLLIVGSFSRKKLSNVVNELEKELVKEINYSVMSDEEFAYRREITDMFLYEILEGDKIVVIDKLNYLT